MSNFKVGDKVGSYSNGKPWSLDEVIRVTEDQVFTRKGGEYDHEGNGVCGVMLTTIRPWDDETEAAFEDARNRRLILNFQWETLSPEEAAKIADVLRSKETPRWH